MTHPYLLDSFISECRCIRTTHLYLHMCDTTHSYLRHDPSMRATQLIHTCDMTYSRRVQSRVALQLLQAKTVPEAAHCHIESMQRDTTHALPQDYFSVRRSGIQLPVIYVRIHIYIYIYTYIYICTYIQKYIHTR